MGKYVAELGGGLRASSPAPNTIHRFKTSDFSFKIPHNRVLSIRRVRLAESNVNFEFPYDFDPRRTAHYYKGQL